MKNFLMIVTIMLSAQASAMTCKELTPDYIENKKHKEPKIKAPSVEAHIMRQMILESANNQQTIQLGYIMKLCENNQEFDIKELVGQILTTAQDQIQSSLMQIEDQDKLARCESDLENLQRKIAGNVNESESLKELGNVPKSLPQDLPRTKEQ
jgi:hypothetical protein